MSFCDLLQKVVPDARIRGTVKVLFAEGEFSSCHGADAPDALEDLATTTGFELQQEPEKEPRYKYVCGKKEIVDQIVKENGFKLAGTLMDLDSGNLKRLLRGKEVTTAPQLEMSAQAIDSFDFTAVPSNSGKNYTLNDSSTGTKTQVLNITSLIIDNGGVPLVEGTDFVYEKSFGSIKFLTVQNSLLTVSVDATATNVAPFEIGATSVRRGFMRVLYYPTVDTIGDQCEPEVQIDVVGFLNFEDSITFSDDSDAEAAITFDVTGRPRLIDLRQLS